MQVVTEHYNDWYQNFGSGWVQVGSDYLGSTTEWVYVPNQDYTNNPQPEHLHRPQRTDKVPHRPTKPPHITEVIIDPRIRNTVLECIFNKLRATNTLSKYIARFDGDFSVAHLRFNTTTKLLSSERAKTYPPLGGPTTPDYVITVSFNDGAGPQGFRQRPTLLNAKTMTHEIIHAEMFRKLMSLAQKATLNVAGYSRKEQVDFVNSIRSDFPGIYDYYRRHKDWQHEQMASHYRTTIADALREFDGGGSSKLYMDLAWEGLRGTNAWNSLSATERARIDSVIASYVKTGSKGCIDPGSKSPK